MARLLSKGVYEFDKNIMINGFGHIVSTFEKKGPLSDYFKNVIKDPYNGEKTYEKAEASLQKASLEYALEMSKMKMDELDIICAGDLINQCTPSSSNLADNAVPFLGVYGACSTMAQTIIQCSMMIEGNFAKKAAAVTSSHFCSAERQYRFPLEYGGQKPPSAQHTVTGSGCVILKEDTLPGVYIKRCAVGNVVDFGIKDANNMGAAMAPAACDTLIKYFKATKTSPKDYDLILSGDLGYIGGEILCDLMMQNQIDISNNYNDCGKMIFDKKKQDTHAGGSGCGCSASVLCAYILPKMLKGEFKNILFMPTGALMSPLTIMQGMAINGVAHIVHLEVK